MLKKHPSSLRLYNAYVLIEWRSGAPAAEATVSDSKLNKVQTGTEEIDSTSSTLTDACRWRLQYPGGCDEIGQMNLYRDDGRMMMNL